MPMLLDGGIGEHPLDVTTAVEHEASKDERYEAHRHHQRSRCQGKRIGGEQDLEAKHRVERDIEQQAGQYAEIGVGPSA